MKITKTTECNITTYEDETLSNDNPEKPKNWIEEDIKPFEFDNIK